MHPVYAKGADTEKLMSRGINKSTNETLQSEKINR